MKTIVFEQFGDPAEVEVWAKGVEIEKRRCMLAGDQTQAAGRPGHSKEEDTAIRAIRHGNFNAASTRWRRAAYGFRDYRNVIGK
jgi:hypothetical protein